MKEIILYIFFLVLFTSSCCGVSKLPVQFPKISNKINRLTHGSDTWKRMPFYVKIHMMGRLGYKGGCSGTIIADKAVLTAAHCLEGRDTSAMLIERFDGKFFISSKFYMHKSYKPYALGSDIGIILFDRSLGVTPMPILITKPVEAGEIALLGGFRVTRERSKANIFEVGRLVISELTKEFVVTRFTGLKPDHYPCYGSSGGGLLGLKIGKDWKIKSAGIVGVVSCGESWACDIPGTHTFHTRTDKYLDFILKHVPDVALT